MMEGARGRLLLGTSRDRPLRGCPDDVWRDKEALGGYASARAYAGSFVFPPPKAEEMYAPEVFGRGAQERVIVE